MFRRLVGFLCVWCSGPKVYDWSNLLSDLFLLVGGSFRGNKAWAKVYVCVCVCVFEHCFSSRTSQLTSRSVCSSLFFSVVFVTGNLRYKRLARVVELWESSLGATWSHDVFKQSKVKYRALDTNTLNWEICRMSQLIDTEKKLFWSLKSRAHTRISMHRQRRDRLFWCIWMIFNSIPDQINNGWANTVAQIQHARLPVDGSRQVAGKALLVPSQSTVDVAAKICTL